MKTTFFKTIITASLFIFSTTQSAQADDAMQNWKNALHTEITSNKSYPDLALRSGIEGTVMMRLKFAKNGDVKGVEILENSGNEILDRSALKLALRINGLPTLPEGKNEVSMVVPMTFQIKDRG
jgi:TonB family protein